MIHSDVLLRHEDDDVETKISFCTELFAECCTHGIPWMTHGLGHVSSFMGLPNCVNMHVSLNAAN